MNKKYIIVLSLSITFLLVIIVNTINFKSRQSDEKSVAGIPLDSQKVAERLASAIKLRTISHQQAEKFKTEPFLQLHKLMTATFPRVEENLDKKVINHYSLLYKWPGKNAELKPVIFLAHLDVVPPEPETTSEWLYPPFSGAIADGFIWGRGTLDDKSAVFGVLEAVENLINQNFVPNRTLYLAFGHDEEIGGKRGAAKIAQYLKQQDVNAILTLDEGMVILNEDLSPAQKMTGIIGIAEKGYVSLILIAKSEGGHSSMPGKESAAGILAKAIIALEENQLPSSLAGASGKMFDFLGPEMGFVKRGLFANRWLFEDIIVSILQGKKSTAAMIRTTTAVTMISGGVKENVLPSQARAVVNFRILPGNTANEVLQHAREVVANPAVMIEFLSNGVIKEPSAISATDTAEFMQIGKTIKQIFKGAIFAPGLVLASTDSRQYQDIAENSYRFAPYAFGVEDLGRIHGVNERIGIKDYQLMIKFYAQLIINLNT